MACVPNPPGTEREKHVRSDQQVAHTVRGQRVGERFGIRRWIVQYGDIRSVAESTIEFVQMDCQEFECFRERRCVRAQPSRAHTESATPQEIAQRFLPLLIATVTLHPSVERPPTFLEPKKVWVFLRCADGVFDMPHARVAHTRWRVRIPDVQMASGHDEDGVNARPNAWVAQ